MIAYIPTGEGWALALLDDDTATFCWWCGPHYKWVEPDCGVWVESPDLKPLVFRSLSAARKAADGLRVT